MNPILIKIAMNPLLYISTLKNEKISVHFNSWYNGKNSVFHIGKFNNIIDALECRDNMIKEFFGVDCSDQYELLNSSTSHKKIGDYIVDENGRCYNKYGIMLKNKKNKTYSEDMYNVYIKNESGGKVRALISPEELKILFDGKSVKVCPIINRYISASTEKGFFYIVDKTGSLGCNTQRKPRNWIKSPLVKKPTKYGVTRTGRKTRYVGKIQIVVDGKKKIFQSVGSFENEGDANLFALDMYYLLMGNFHKSDKRRLK